MSEEDQDKEDFAAAVVEVTDAMQVVRSENPGAKLEAEIEELARRQVHLEEIRRPEHGARGAAIFAASQAFREQEAKVNGLLQKMLGNYKKRFEAEGW